MAILTCLPGLEVAIEVDGQRAREYDADPEEVRKCADQMSFHQTPQTRRPGWHGDPYVLKYIEAKPGKPFCFVLDGTTFNVKFDNFKSKDGVQKEAKIYGTFVVDGYKTGTNRMPVRLSYEKSGFITGNDVTGWKTHTYRFGKLDIVLEGVGGPGSQSRRAQQYGSLKVELFLRVGTGRIEPWGAVSGPVPIHSIGEKELKGRAVDSRVEFDSEPTNRPRASETVEYADPQKRPIAVFEFRYRTMEGLHQEFIVPRPVLKAEDKKVVDVEEEYERIKKYEPSSAGVKREAPASSPPNPSADALNDRKKRRLDEHGEKVVVDLTGDVSEDDAPEDDPDL